MILVIKEVSTNAQGQLWTLFQGPGHDRAQVVQFHRHSIRPLLHRRPGQAGRGFVRERDIVVNVPVAQDRSFARLEQPVAAILADALQHAVARLACGRRCDGDQRLVDKLFEEIENVVIIQLIVTRHGLRCLQGPTAGEDRQPLENQAFLFIEQIPTPVNHGLQGLHARQRGATAASQQAKAVVEPSGDLIDAEHAQAGGSQFKRQRDAVEPPHDFGNRERVCRAQLKFRAQLLRAGQEQLDPLRVADLFEG